MNICVSCLTKKLTSLAYWSSVIFIDNDFLHQTSLLVVRLKGGISPKLDCLYEDVLTDTVVAVKREVEEEGAGACLMKNYNSNANLGHYNTLQIENCCHGLNLKTEISHD